MTTTAHHHTETGYNYRVSNVLTGIGRGQLEVLDEARGGPCLLSSSSLEPADQERVIDIVRGLFRS